MSIIGIVLGVALLLWAIGTGIGTHPNNRAAIFAGPVGFLVNLIVIAAGVVLILVGAL